MFEGHQFIKICGDEWVFDITEFKGYKVTVNKTGTVDKYELAFTVNENSEFNKFINVPVKVLKETRGIINSYRVCALV